MEDEEKQEEEIFGRLAKLCSKSELCTPDLLKKIQELGGDSALADKVIARLREENYLDDERYATTYARDKFRINRWGRIKIRYYLRMKGLNEDIIETGLMGIDEEEYVQLLLRTMKEKAKSVQKKEKYEKMGQIIRFTHSRGFEPELIHRYLNDVVS